MSSAKRILLIIGGGIAAYKCLDLIRRLRERGHHVRAVMTKAAHQFVTPLSVGADQRAGASPTSSISMTNARSATSAWRVMPISIVVAPATADLIARMAGGHADDLATAVLLATDKPVLVAPAMNPRMWRNPATRRNVAQLKADGIRFVGPPTGEMAERGEAGPAASPRFRTSSPPSKAHSPQVRRAAAASPAGTSSSPAARRTSRSIRSAISPTAHRANRATTRRRRGELGARVTLISGPVSLPRSAGVEIVRVKTAEEMLAAVKAALPADIAVFAAAVADWRVDRIQTREDQEVRAAGAPDAVAHGKSRHSES